MKYINLVAVAVLLAVLTACAGLSGSSSTPTPTPTRTPTPTPTPTLQASVNHVVIMLQENRSVDSYFWAMTDYRSRNNIPIVSSDGKIRDGSDAVGYTNPGPNGTVAPYHTGS